MGITQTGTTPLTNKSEFYGSDYSFIKPADISISGIDYGLEGLSSLGLENGRLVPADSVLMVSIGGSIGKVGLVDRDCSCNQQINYITLKLGILPKLVYYFFKSPYFQGEVLSLAPTTTMPILSKGKWDTIPLPVPPLAEQKRIVEKCDRMLVLCDEIEKRQQQRQSSLLKMNEGAIAQLLTAQTPDDFQHHWQSICNNFDLLYSIPETIPKLRQAILQLAMQGMFISERADDEHNAKSQSNKVSDFVKVLNGYAFKSEWFIDDGIRLLRNANVGHNTLRWDDTARISLERSLEFKRFNLDEGDIVISLDRPLINTGLKLAKVTKKDLPCLLLQRVGKFDFKTNEVDPDYFFRWLQSPIFITSIDPGRSNGVPHISSKQIEAILFNPPPLAEQKRIVAKVDSLLSLCDTLEAKLKAARDSSTTLMEVAVKQILVA